MVFKGKRILVLCKEYYSYPFYFLVQKWKQENEVAAFFFNPPETKYAKCSLNDMTYYAFKELEGVKLYTSDHIADEFTSTLEKEEIIDVTFLHEIEEKYTHFRNLNNQIMSTQVLTRHYHYRNFFHKSSYYQQLNWLILNYKNVISILDDFRPDCVLDTDNAELARAVMREVCYQRGIPYVNVDNSRFENYKLYSYNLNSHYSLRFAQDYQRNLEKSDQKLQSRLDDVYDFKAKSVIMNHEFKYNSTSQYEPSSLIMSLKRIYGLTRYFVAQDAAGNNRQVKKANPLIYPNSWEYIKFTANFECRKQLLMRKNRFFHEPEEVDYVYMPLHLIPESTTFSVSPMYVNELFLIEAISKSLPAGWWLYVKEHQSMVGERKVEFYEKVNRLPNVKMVQINYYKDPKPWIIKSRGVVTISGTTAFEAAMLGKRAIVLADTPFSLIEGVERLLSIEDMPLAIARFKQPLHNEKSCAAYLQTVMEQGFPINMMQLLLDGEKILRGKKQKDETYQSNLDQLEQLFLKGCEDYLTCDKDA